MAAQSLSSFPELQKAIADNPEASAELDTLFDKHHEQLSYLLAKVAKLEEEKRLSRAERFAASSEQDPQYALFNEAEQEQATEPEVQPETVTVPAHARQKPRRKPLPKDLPRVVVDHDLDHKTCHCGSDKVHIGTKTSEQLDVIPAQMYVIEHRRHSYKCPRCSDAVPETAKMPAQPIPKSQASPGLLAHVAVAKYADGLPLYRQSKMFERVGVDLPRQTLASHMVRVGELVEPLITRLLEHARGYDIVQMDETRVQVLAEDNRTARSQSWMWVIRGGPPDRPAIVFHYDPSRAAAVPAQLMSDYKGYLQSDGYKGYGRLLAGPGVTGLGCWAHVRRKFVKAQQAQPKGKPSKKLQQVLAWIGRLYAFEKQWQPLDADARRANRQAQSKPILEQILAWAERQNVNPQSLLGKAISYMSGEWPRLLVYLEDGRLLMDNNLVENAIRPFAVGRKNWLFSASANGATASAALYSLIETAHANDVNPYAYLKLVFTRLPNTPADRIDSLLPWQIPAEELQQQILPLGIAR